MSTSQIRRTAMTSVTGHFVWSTYCTCGNIEVLSQKLSRRSQHHAVMNSGGYPIGSGQYLALRTIVNRASCTRFSIPNNGLMPVLHVAWFSRCDCSWQMSQSIDRLDDAEGLPQESLRSTRLVRYSFCSGCVGSVSAPLLAIGAVLHPSNHPSFTTYVVGNALIHMYEVAAALFAGVLLIPTTCTARDSSSGGTGSTRRIE